jgi:phosphohistidine phosphatase
VHDRPMRTLMLMRHASTEHSRPGHRDKERRLTSEGRDQAVALGDQLRSDHVEIDLVLCSSALRAQQTVEALRSAAPVVVSDRLYNAGGDEILEAVRELDDDQLHVLVVGHGPGLPALVNELADPDRSDPKALAVIDRRFPAGTLATLAVDGPWSELEQATLVSVRLPPRP